LLEIIKNILGKKPAPGITISDAEVEDLGIRLKEAVSTVFGRSLAIREVDSGSDNAAEIEINNLSTPHYDIERFGISFVASPRHADVIMITGPVTRSLKTAVLKTFEAMPRPGWVIAVGDDACDGGIYTESYAVLGGADQVLPVDYKIPGNPPTPLEIMRGLVAFMALIKSRCKREPGASVKG